MVTCPGPGGPVTFSSATYVIRHVNVNMTCHVIIGRKGCPRARSPEQPFRLPGTGHAGTGPACRRAGLPAAEGTRGAGAGALRAKRGPCFRETSPTAWAISPGGLRRRNLACRRLAWVAGVNAAGTTGTASPAPQEYYRLARPAPGSGAAVACWRGTQAAGRGRVSPPPGASRPAAGASLA